MKKILIILVVTFFATSSFAQSDAKFRFGIKGAPSLAWYKPDVKKSFESKGARARFGWGLMTEFRLTKVISFTTGLEVNYSAGELAFKDSVYYLQDDTNRFYMASRKYNLTYVSLPLKLKMKSPEIGMFTYFGQFGIDIDVRAKAKADDTGHFANNPGTEIDVVDLDVKKDMNLLKLGMGIGVGVEINLAGSTSFVTSINYHNGFTNALKKESELLKNNTGNLIQQNAKSHFVDLTVGFLF